MRRLLALALTFLLGHASMALAGETILQSGQRIVSRQATADRAALYPTTQNPRRGDPALQGPTTLAQSGMRARNKILIGLGIAAAVAGAALVIDRGVEDSTPSSRGER